MDILIDAFAKIAGGYGIGPTLLNVYGIQKILNLTCGKWLPLWGSSHVVGERALVRFALSVMLTHATSPRVRGLIMMHTLNIGGSKPFPGRKHSIAPRFGYKQLTGLFA